LILKIQWGFMQRFKSAAAILILIVVFGGNFALDLMKVNFGMLDYGTFASVRMFTGSLVLAAFLFFGIGYLFSRDFRKYIWNSNSKSMPAPALWMVILLAFFLAASGPIFLLLNAHLGKNSESIVSKCTVRSKVREQAGFFYLTTYRLEFAQCSGGYVSSQWVGPETFEKIAEGSQIDIVSRPGFWSPVVADYKVL
jgi:hypothetical protein